MRHWIVICFYFCCSFVLLSEAMNVGPSSVINRHSQGDIFSPIGNFKYLLTNLSLLTQF